MNTGDIRPGDKTLERTLENVRNTPGEARKFASDPEGYLKSKGVDTTGLRIAPTQGELTDQALDAVAGGRPIVCTSVGAGAGVTVCSSVGE